MIKGIDVILYSQVEIGVDEFNRPIFEDKPITIKNVLIGEPSSDDVINELNLSGKRIAYLLGIPKGDTNHWKNAIVEFWGRKFKTVGEPTQGIEENIPLCWNKKVKVEAYE